MLSGIKIIDFSNYLPGPFASLRLAEMGAEVIKIEALEGDPARNTGVQKDGTGIVFLAQNRQKKSIALNLKTNEGREIALQLISKADAVLESFRPGVMGKLGLDYDTVRKSNPGIVYCSITGYGNAGNMSKLGSHDLNYMGISGVLSQLKDPNGKPTHPALTFADFFGGFAASERILAGLNSKYRTGEGSYHCISISDVMVSLLGNHLFIDKLTGYSSGIPELGGTIISYAIYETKDCRYVTLAALEPKFWRNFCYAVEKEEWKEAHFSKAERSNAIFREMETLFASYTLAEWTEFAQRVDCCLAPVLEVSELEQFPLFNHNGTLFQFLNGIPQVKMHGSYKTGELSDPPAIGEHSFEVLKEELMATDRQIEKWKENGVI
jgi:alpha-methylacyl-CoA racemase